jgi:hypothetical protein
MWTERSPPYRFSEVLYYILRSYKLRKKALFINSLYTLSHYYVQLSLTSSSIFPLYAFKEIEH